MCVRAAWPGLLLRNTEEKGCCQVIAVSRVPPGDNKLILDVFHALWGFRLIVIFCLVTCSHPSGALGEIAQSHVVLSFPYLVLQSFILLSSYLRLYSLSSCCLALEQNHPPGGCSPCETADLSFCCLPFFLLFVLLFLLLSLAYFPSVPLLLFLPQISLT